MIVLAVLAVALCLLGLAILATHLRPRPATGRHAAPTRQTRAGARRTRQGDT